MATSDPSSYEEALAILGGLASLANAASVDAHSPEAHLEIDRDQSRLHIAEARYRALVEQIPAVTFIASLVGGISEIYVSPQIESLLGFTQEEWVSDPVLWFRQLHPDDRPLLTREFAEACATGRPLRGICRAFARDGHMVWVHGEARFVRDEQGRPLFLQGIAFDVTEQQRAIETRQQLLQEQARSAEADRERQRLQRIFDGLPAIVIIMREPQHKVEFMNRAARALLGTDDAGVIGQPFAQAFADLAPPLLSMLDHVYKEGVIVEDRELAIATPSWGDEPRYFHFVSQPLLGNDGRVGGVLSHIVEVTTQVRARHEREELVDELQRTLRYNEIFAGMLGHDLRNPLGAIMSGAQLALRRNPPESVAKPLDRILAAGERMARMIEQLLDFTRIRVGRGLELQLDTVNLATLCKRAIDELELANPQWKLVLDVDGDPVGQWDDDRLLQVISNLVSNGLKHGDPAAPLHVKIDGTKADSVRVAVHNLGAIPPELVPSLFDPFRGTQHRRDRARGLGLGLFITKEIVVAHAGTIDVTSDAAGTTFIVTLPRYARTASPSTGQVV